MDTRAGHRPPRRITVVEDDENIAGLLAFLLEREGFAPEVVGDGRAALEHAARSEPPSAVVLDQLLPCRNGLAVATALRADPRWGEVPIVLLGATRSIGGAAARVDAWLEKPFDPGALIGELKRLAKDPP